MKRPGFMFYPLEWRGDLKLRECSLAARGLWMDLLCLMHEGSPYGHLTTPNFLTCALIGVNAKVYSALIEELEAAGVISRTESGTIFSRRMVKDEVDRGIRAANGTHGGRPRKATPVKPAMQPAWSEFAALYPAHRFDEQMACQMFISRGDDAGILAGLKRAVASDDWMKDAGKFVPWASKFIAEGKYSGFKEAAPAATPYARYKPPT